MALGQGQRAGLGVAVAVEQAPGHREARDALVAVDRRCGGTSRGRRCRRPRRPSPPRRLAEHVGPSARRRPSRRPGRPRPRPARQLVGQAPQGDGQALGPGRPARLGDPFVGRVRAEVARAVDGHAAQVGDARAGRRNRRGRGPPPRPGRGRAGCRRAAPTPTTPRAVRRPVEPAGGPARWRRRRGRCRRGAPWPPAVRHRAGSARRRARPGAGHAPSRRRPPDRAGPGVRRRGGSRPPPRSPARASGNHPATRSPTRSAASSTHRDHQILARSSAKPPSSRNQPGTARSCSAAHTASRCRRRRRGHARGPPLQGASIRPAAGMMRAQSTRQPDGPKAVFGQQREVVRIAGGEAVAVARRGPAAGRLPRAPVRRRRHAGRRAVDDGAPGEAAWEAPSHRERCAGPELAGVEVGGRGRLARELDDLDRLGEAGQPRGSTSGRRPTPAGRSLSCSAGMSTSPGPAASHRRAARLTAEPM